MPPTIILIAHGSRLEPANEEVRILGKKLEDKIGKKIIPAFLEIAQPSIPTALDLAIEGGAKELLVFPYFLTQGRHVLEDIPRIIQEKQNQHPDIKFTLLPYLGTQSELLQLIAAAL